MITHTYIATSRTQVMDRYTAIHWCRWVEQKKKKICNKVQFFEILI